MKYNIMPARKVQSKSESVFTPQTTVPDLVGGAIKDLLLEAAVEDSSRPPLDFALLPAREEPHAASKPARCRTPLDAPLGMLGWLIVSNMGAAGLPQALGGAPEVLLSCKGLTRGPFRGAIATRLPSSTSLRSSLLAASFVTSSQLSPD